MCAGEETYAGRLHVDCLRGAGRRPNVYCAARLTRTDIQLYDGGPPRFYAQFTFALQFTSTGKSTALLYFWLRQNHRH